MTVGEKIKEARQLKGLTQQELADLLGYKSRSSINKIEVGERDIPRSQIVVIARALGVTPAYLMGWEDEKAAPKTEPISDKKLELTENEKAIVDIFKNLTETQQGELIGRAKAMAEMNEDLYKQEDIG